MPPPSFDYQSQSSNPFGYPYYPQSSNPGMPIQVSPGHFVLPESNQFANRDPRRQEEEDDNEEEEEYRVGLDDDNDDDDEAEESVPETQGPSTKTSTRALRTNWSGMKEACLARAWLHVSEDKVIGNQQKSEHFWKRVRDHFNKQRGGIPRTVHQVNSKWNKMLTKVNNFNCLYQQLNHTRPSGSSDADLIERTLNQYKKLYERKGFANIEAWREMKDHLKWAPVERACGGIGKSSSKRTKNTESGQFSTSNEGDVPDLNENSTPTHPTRKGKKSVDSSSSTTSLVDEVKNFNLLKEVEMDTKKAERDELRAIRIARERSVTEAMERQKEMIETQKTILEQEQFDRDVATFTTPHGHMTGSYLANQTCPKTNDRDQI
ncbi:hypothetical protein SSX86_010514 [Deinandra increscens subsp. villosa]|uniref:No apical meristem-associated C-terminal domain-containing protein n=1 Tax=Deinandra increscens subsp. villosa TaxID=3103831 RepID=A0AAP0D848_9ASTR